MVWIRVKPPRNGKTTRTSLPEREGSNLDSYIIPEQGGVHKSRWNAVDEQGCHHLPPIPQYYRA
jgi:hypothetical protein